LASLVFVPDNISDVASIIVAIVSLHYGMKLVRLSKEIEFVTLKGGRAPYYIMAGLGFLALNRIADLLAENILTDLVGSEFATVFDDPPALLAAVFIFLGLRNMYEIYRKSGTPKTRDPSSEEIWTVKKLTD